MLAAMRHALPSLVQRYGSRQEVLNEKLGWFLDPRRLQTLHGGTQASPLLRDMFRGRTLGTLVPTFTGPSTTRSTASREAHRDPPASRRAAHSRVVIDDDPQVRPHSA